MELILFRVEHSLCADLHCVSIAIQKHVATSVIIGTMLGHFYVNATVSSHSDAVSHFIKKK